MIFMWAVLHVAMAAWLAGWMKENMFAMLRRIQGA